mgnify:CR=1 FL=1
MSSKSVYRGFNQSQLDQLYNNQAACPDEETLFAGLQERSAKLYETFSFTKNIRYGTSSRECFDYFPSGQENAPTFIFIHGGYWEFCNKEDYAFVADGVIRSGYNVILAEYNEAPNVSMTSIIAEITRLLDFLEVNMSRFNISRGKVVLGGHSAGGHLASMLRDHPLVSHCMAISGIFDLYPISRSYLNEKLQLTDIEIEQFSPIRHIKAGVPTSIHNGSNELMELIRHSLEYAEALLASGNAVIYQQMPDHNHFTELDELSYPDGKLLLALNNLIKM